MIEDKDIDYFIKKLKNINIKSNERWAIYGTGNGAELIFKALSKMSINNIYNIIERDESIYIGKQFHGIPIKKLSEVCDSLDGIIIAAINSHQIIKYRILNNLTEKQLKNIRIVDIFAYNTPEEKIQYVEYIEKAILREYPEFVQFDEQGYQAKEGDTKIIAWYLPQFHQIEINNKFHGQGFTEWINTSKAIPMFMGHYQPHIPYDVGYYDLLNLETFKRQIYLAKHYGVYGFCIHYYWFSGKKLMEKPLELFLKHKELDMPFCLSWATENWTALWDGGNNEVMLEQKFNAEDSKRFMDDILPYMKDSRYIKINGRPVLALYRVNLFKKQDVKHLLDIFRGIAKNNGFPDLYIMLTNAFSFEDNVNEWGADALVEYPPFKMLELMESYRPSGYLNPYFKGSIFDVSSFIRDKRYMLKHTNQPYFRSALTSWDNTARKATSNAWILHGMNPETFQKLLKDIIVESRNIHSVEENIVFVNSWNEWAEGSHLEPDMKYGYGYLQAIKETLEGLKGS